MKKQLPQTSHAANKAATQEMREQHYQKIINALQVLVCANYEKIAETAGLDKHQIGRRMSELERAQVVYKSGLQSSTSSGRKAFNYSLTGHPKTEAKKKEVVYREEEKSAHQFASDLINNTLKPEYKQPDLFS